MKIRTRLIDINSASDAEMEKSASAVRNGAIAVFPTDTVYGIGTGSSLLSVTEKIYRIKGRASSKPLPILIDSIRTLKRLAYPGTKAMKLAAGFWPGALTLVVKPKPGAENLAKGFKGLGIRIPGNKRLRKWLRMIDAPLISTSANLSGQPACKRAEDAVSVFSGKVEYILYGGKPSGKESTVVDVTGRKLKILREGAISAGEIFKIANCPDGQSVGETSGK